MSAKSDAAVMVAFADRITAMFDDVSPSSEPSSFELSPEDLSLIAVLLLKGARALDPPPASFEIPGVGRVGPLTDAPAPKYEYEIPVEPGRVIHRSVRADGSIYESRTDKVRNRLEE